MNYGFTKTIQASFADAEAKVRAELQKAGFGILTEIDVQATLKKKIDADFRPYKILGACNPPFALKALTAEAHIGLMLPCNVVVQQTDAGIEISAIDPVASMIAVKNAALDGIATEVRQKLEKVIAAL
ncbi:MAG: DUF302 domain-containing protein [Spirochaetes bacterium]|nr:DUF302 domain-containing protein [Spirochaetota bacterium]